MNFKPLSRDVDIRVALPFCLCHRVLSMAETHYGWLQRVGFFNPSLLISHSSQTAYKCTKVYCLYK